jgi:hypothetical protein
VLGRVASRSALAIRRFSRSRLPKTPPSGAVADATAPAAAFSSGRKDVRHRSLCKPQVRYLADARQNFGSGWAARERRAGPGCLEWWATPGTEARILDQQPARADRGRVGCRKPVMRQGRRQEMQ